MEVIKHRQQTPVDLIGLERQLSELLKEKGKYDQNHIMVLFKMYSYPPGLIQLYEEMNLTEEMLNYYIAQRDSKGILNLCQKKGQNESNLWVQALKYFAQSGSKNEIKTILSQIQNIQSLSPSLILNILSQDNPIDLETVREYFLYKLEQDKKEIDSDQLKVDSNTSKAREHRQYYYQLKTQAKKFQETNCAHPNCDHQVTLPSVHFLCGHSFSENCLTNLLDEERDNKGQLVCARCSKDHSYIKEQKKDYDSQIEDTTTFFDNL